MALTTYSQDEMISVSQLSRHLKQMMDQLDEKQKYKFGIIKNNKLKAALVSAEFLDELEALLRQCYKHKTFSTLFRQIEAKYTA